MFTAVRLVLFVLLVFLSATEAYAISCSQATRPQKALLEASNLNSKYVKLVRGLLFNRESIDSAYVNKVLRTDRQAAQQLGLTTNMGPGALSCVTQMKAKAINSYLKLLEVFAGAVVSYKSLPAVQAVKNSFKELVEFRSLKRRKSNNVACQNLQKIMFKANDGCRLFNPVLEQRYAQLSCK